MTTEICSPCPSRHTFRALVFPNLHKKKFTSDGLTISGRTETVCVIGIVKVKVLGTVQNGERIYVALDTPGVAVPETQIPLRPMADRSPTLLGQALESQTSYRLDSVHLVRCFVSIVLGIQSGQITNAIDNLQERIQGSFQEVMIKDRTRWLKGD